MYSPGTWSSQIKIKPHPLLSCFPTPYLVSALDSTILHPVSGEDNQPVTSVIGLVTILSTAAIYYAFSFKGEEQEFPKLPGVQLYHARNSFQQRYDFLHSNIKRNPDGFSFNVLHSIVIALAGKDVRKVQ